MRMRKEVLHLRVGAETARGRVRQIVETHVRLILCGNLLHVVGLLALERVMIVVKHHAIHRLQQAVPQMVVQIVLLNVIMDVLLVQEPAREGAVQIAVAQNA